MKEPGDERFPLVDRSGQVIGSALRSACHGNPDLLHPVVHCLVLNPAGDLLLQLRHRDKVIAPGKWDTSVGGHVALGETIEQALAREMIEEIGLDPQDAPPRFLYRYIMRNEIESELVHTFSCVSTGPFRMQAEEIEELRFWSRQEIRAAFGTGRLTGNFEEEFGRLEASEAGRPGGEWTGGLPGEE